MQKGYILKRAQILSLLPPSGAGRVSFAQRHAALGAEAERIGKIRSASAAPEVCGNAIPPAPARGAFRVLSAQEMAAADQDCGSPRGDRRSADHGGADLPRAIQMLDLWDVMEAQARRRWRAECDDLRAADQNARLPKWRPPFTAAQVNAARRYRNLFEAVGASGIRCSLASMVGGSGSSVGAPASGVSEAVLADAMALAEMQGVLGRLWAIEPSDRRAGVGARWLLDEVAVAQCSLNEVLRKLGWHRDGRGRAALREGLRRALDALYMM